ncbi:aspartate/glutamate racemase family protein [uncultured Roseobacter sp.]|uniref:aspartate/glutamate racemase family protein n=1 Tax=uncultured Roseobacter sp. TaxID=114847 RepID=UPI002630B333|nr:aspartate/glutamate racemase family protein [uncultured Roseobacter sp.]
MIVLINPNSTGSMTDAMLRTARAVAPGAVIEGWTSHAGPPAIQGEVDGALAEAPLLALVEQAAAAGASAIIIGCFDDTALSQARAAVSCPVIGIGQAAYHLAATLGPRFSVVTTLQVSVPILERNIQAYGLGHALSRVRASDVPVLDLERDATAATDRVLSEVQAAAAQDDVQSVVLGCAGMVDIAGQAPGGTRVHLIDGVRAAAMFAASVEVV